MIYQCPCGFATDDLEWLESHREDRHAPQRAHDVTGLTASELERARRDLQVSLALALPDSPTRVPILAHLSAIDAELAERTNGRPAGLPSSPFALILAGR